MSNVFNEMGPCKPKRWLAGYDKAETHWTPAKCQHDVLNTRQSGNLVDREKELLKREAERQFLCLNSGCNIGVIENHVLTFRRHPYDLNRENRWREWFATFKDVLGLVGDLPANIGWMAYDEQVKQGIA